MSPAPVLSLLSPGRELASGKYRIVRPLGAGGMGAVFEAQNTVTRKRVAIKCLLPERSNDAQASARLLREAEAACRVRHPNVVDVYDAGREGDLVYLVMEYLEGEPLSRVLVRGELPVHQLIALLLPAMRAVAEAHRQGVVHRDIKPDNIFLAQLAAGEAPVPKVLDFGISKLEPRNGDELTLTRSGSAIGTPRYMAYEQLMGDRTVDARADVYAFGVILYEALTGRMPYEAETYPELIVKIARGELLGPKQLRAELPTTLDRLVCWALARDREERIANMEELIRELQPFSTPQGLRAEMTIATQSVAAAAPARASSTIRRKVARPTSAPPRRRKRAGLAALALIAVGAGAWWWSRRVDVQPAQATTDRAQAPRVAAPLPRAPEPPPAAADTSLDSPPAQAPPSPVSVPVEAAHPVLRPRTRPAPATKLPATALETKPPAVAPEPTVTPPEPAAPAVKATAPGDHAPFRVKLPESGEF